MSALAKVTCGVVVSVLLFSAQTSVAAVVLHKIRVPQDCPDGLVIKSKAIDGGMVQFDVYVDSDAIASNTLYRGRSRSVVVLRIATAQGQIASAVVHGAPEGKGGRRTRYQFRLAPSAVRTSELQVGVSLYEKDGMSTVGGGHSLRVYLAKFEPKIEKITPKLN